MPRARLSKRHRAPHDTVWMPSGRHAVLAWRAPHLKPQCNVRTSMPLHPLDRKCCRHIQRDPGGLTRTALECAISSTAVPGNALKQVSRKCCGDRMRAIMVCPCSLHSQHTTPVITSAYADSAYKGLTRRDNRANIEQHASIHQQGQRTSCSGVSAQSVMRAEPAHHQPSNMSKGMTTARDKRASLPYGPPWLAYPCEGQQSHLVGAGWCLAPGVGEGRPRNAYVHTPISACGASMAMSSASNPNV